MPEPLRHARDSDIGSRSNALEILEKGAPPCRMQAILWLQLRLIVPVPGRQRPAARVTVYIRYDVSASPEMFNMAYRSTCIIIFHIQAD
jgi:hypothetical protein